MLFNLCNSRSHLAAEAKVLGHFSKTPGRRVIVLPGKKGSSIQELVERRVAKQRAALQLLGPTVFSFSFWFHCLVDGNIDVLKELHSSSETLNSWLIAALQSV